MVTKGFALLDGEVLSRPWTGVRNWMTDDLASFGERLTQNPR